MSLIESEAAFAQRCVEVANNTVIRDALNHAGVKSFSALAFSMGTPQVAPTEQQFNAFISSIFGAAGANVGQVASLRRLHFEATALVVASIKEHITGDGDKSDAVKQLPVVEKRQRQENQSTRLAGISITGELSPSHSLVDLTNHILETNSIVWIAPSKCSKRDDEVQQSIKERQTTVQVENNTLKLGVPNQEVRVDTGSDIKLLWAWQRRGIAMDQCHLLSWSVHDSWITYLMHMLSKEQPESFRPIKTDQLLRADREIWTLIAQEFKDSLKRRTDADPIPLDAVFRRLMTDPRITMLLLPLPAVKGHDKEKHATESASKASRPAGSSKQANQSKKCKTRAEKACPDELRKYNLRFENGPICYAYNMKDGCKLRAQGNPARCSKGHHVCANCHKPNHSVVNCRALSGQKSG